MKTEYINESGMAEIRKFLADNHKKDISEIYLPAWAQEAEQSLGNGNPPIIEIKAWDSVSGHTEEFTVSDSGVSFDEDE